MTWKPWVKLRKDYYMGPGAGPIRLYHYSLSKHGAKHRDESTAYKCVYKFTDGYFCFQCKTRTPKNIVTQALLSDVQFEELGIWEECLLMYRYAKHKV